MQSARVVSVMYSGEFNLDIPGWDSGWVNWESGGPLFGEPSTNQPTSDWGGGGDMYTGQGWIFQQDWNWLPGMNITSDDILTPIAQTTYDVLDPYYGEGGILEPVTVVVDPDRNIKDEYGVDLGLVAVAAVAALALLK